MMQLTVVVQSQTFGVSQALALEGFSRMGVLLAHMRKVAYRPP